MEKKRVRPLGRLPRLLRCVAVILSQRQQFTQFFLTTGQILAQKIEDQINVRKRKNRGQ